jgi:two-component system sensor histidine kinase DegS
MTMPATPPGPDGDLAAQLGRDLATLDTELGEIDLLVGQARTEATRHEQKRAQAAERVGTPDKKADPKELAEAYAQLVTLTRRAVLMEAQVDLLEGKRKALARHRDAVAAIADAVAASSAAPGELTGGRDEPLPPSLSRVVLSAQEDLRREIARTMHDGPAQSLTNIVLQAEILERLLARDPGAAPGELRRLVGMVQQTLDATKRFIFDVRPMVLDDLGLVPTLRRAARERGRRANVPVEFDSLGPDQRLPMEVESAIFRLLDDALGAYLALEPERVTLRLDWTEELEARLGAQRMPAAPPEEEPLPEVPSGRDVPDAIRQRLQPRSWSCRRPPGGTRRSERPRSAPPWRFSRTAPSCGWCCRWAHRARARRRHDRRSRTRDRRDGPGDHRDLDRARDGRAARAADHRVLRRAAGQRDRDPGRRGARRRLTSRGPPGAAAHRHVVAHVGDPPGAIVTSPGTHDHRPIGDARATSYVGGALDLGADSSREAPHGARQLAPRLDSSGRGRPGSRGVRADPRPHRDRRDHRPHLPGWPGFDDPVDGRLVRLGRVTSRIRRPPAQPAAFVRPATVPGRTGCGARRIDSPPGRAYRRPRRSSSADIAREGGEAHMTLLNALISLVDRDQEGQGLAEYALILALIAIVAIIALIFLGGQISTILSTVGSSV